MMIYQLGISPTKLSMRRSHIIVYLITFLLTSFALNSSSVSLRNAKLTVDVIHSDINALILDYLTTEGYPSAAAKFSKEANLSPRQEEDSVKARQQIQHSIHMGSIQDAIEALNELEPQVSLHISFHFILNSLAMIRHEFMHHSYSLRVVDEKNYQLQSSE
jgi:hypothetical protein